MLGIEYVVSKPSLNGIRPLMSSGVGIEGFWQPPSPKQRPGGAGTQDGANPAKEMPASQMLPFPQSSVNIGTGEL